MPWCGRQTGPGSPTTGGQDGARSTRSTWRAASIPCSCASPGRGDGHRHRLVARWRAPRDHVRRRVESRGGLPGGVVSRERGWVRHPPRGPERRKVVAGLAPRHECRHRVVTRWDPARLHELLWAGLIGSCRSGRSRRTARPRRWSRRTVACQMEGVPCGRPTAHRSPSQRKQGDGTRAIPGPSGRQRRWNGRANGDRLVHCTKAGTAVGSSASATGEVSSRTASERGDVLTRRVGRSHGHGNAPVRCRNDLCSSESSWWSCPDAPDPPRAPQPPRRQTPRARQHRGRQRRDHQPRSPSLTS